jgi:Holliday junction resolvase RusA-like endonuclease
MIRLDGEVFSSKNSRSTDMRTGRTFKSKGARLNEREFLVQLLAQKPTWQAMIHGREYPLVVVFRLRRKTRRKFDYNNLLQGVLDAMVKAGYLPDDDMVHVIAIPAEWQHERSGGGCDFWLIDLGDYQRMTEGTK